MIKMHGFCLSDKGDVFISVQNWNEFLLFVIYYFDECLLYWKLSKQSGFNRLVHSRSFDSAVIILNRKQKAYKCNNPYES